MEGTKAIQKFLPSRGHETFVFVHGAWHGTWCWERVETLLQALGHKTVAVDLPAHGKARGVRCGFDADADLCAGNHILG